MFFGILYNGCERRYRGRKRGGHGESKVKRVFFYMFLYIFLFPEFNMLTDLPSFFISSVRRL
jgi:hypothetical protein